MDQVSITLKQWFSERPLWVQIAAQHLSQGEGVDSSFISELARKSIAEAQGLLKDEIP